mmetsp:Transcript_14564/g.24200  ORF Transcript_14564/g.24200 Transcript_14564/m.24200 type:complete len:584 (+) Transcript_14564:132-1883(+)
MSNNVKPVILEGQSAEHNDRGEEYLSSQKWQKMNTTSTISDRASAFLEGVRRRITGDLEGDDLLRVMWLSSTLFFIVGGYWLLRSLKDPIMSVINGVEYIPQAKIASLFVVLGLVIIYNKMLDIYPKHQLFYMMGIGYGALFALMGLLLIHPTIGLANSNADPTRFLGWLSYVTIESFGSMVVQCYWALVNSSVNVQFAKKNFGLIVAGAQIGSILGPTLATQAETIGITPLYLLGSIVMFLMVSAMYYYIKTFGVPGEEEDRKKKEEEALMNNSESGSGKTNSIDSNSKSSDKKPHKNEGIMEGFYLFWEHDYVKGIFAVSSLYMVQVTVIDYMMKVLAKERYALQFPDDPQLALRAFASFMGYFGQTTNSISFLFSLFGTGMVIKRFGLTTTLVAFPALMLICTVFIWIMPNIWIVFIVMMVIKGMSYALLNPTKEILYQATASNVKFKCKSWIDTFGQRGSKAAGSIITNAFASSMADLVNYGSLVGIIIAAFMIWVSDYMGKKFEVLSENGEKVGEPSKILAAQLAALQNQKDDTSCGFAEEGQDDAESATGGGGGGDVELTSTQYDQGNMTNEKGATV